MPLYLHLNFVRSKTCILGSDSTVNKAVSLLYYCCIINESNYQSWVFHTP